MQYGVVQGRSASKFEKPTTVRLASHFAARIKRPSRLRNRSLMIVLAVLGTTFLIFGHRNFLELERLSTYMPAGFTDIISQYGSEFQDTRWDDKVHVGEVTTKKPKFLLLIPARNSSANLCKTLLSAAILNYPPPTLVGYRRNDTSDSSILNTTYGFLLGKEVRDNDIVLIVEENAWFQLPAEVLLDRFVHSTAKSSFELSTRYYNSQSPLSNSKTDLATSIASRILFGATKQSSNTFTAHASLTHTQSPPSRSKTDQTIEGIYEYPKSMSSNMLMGRVSELRPLYERAIEILQDRNNSTTQHVLAQILDEQEYARSLLLPVPVLSPSARFRALLSSKQSLPPQPNVTLQQDPDRNTEFGIMLDYPSSVFQNMYNSTHDLKTMIFSKAVNNSITLPPDLESTLPPVPQNILSTMSSTDRKKQWNDVKLSINTKVPGGSIPVILSFGANLSHSSAMTRAEMWEEMYYHPYLRTLMVHYLHGASNSKAKVDAEEARMGGGEWWNLRGGKGGVWTDRGMWLEWDEVCGGWDEGVVGDGLGRLIAEKEKAEVKESGAENDGGGGGEDKEGDANEGLSEEDQINLAAEKFRAELEGEEKELAKAQEAQKAADNEAAKSEEVAESVVESTENDNGGDGATEEVAESAGEEAGTVTSDIDSPKHGEAEGEGKKDEKTEMTSDEAQAHTGIGASESDIELKKDGDAQEKEKDLEIKESSDEAQSMLHSSNSNAKPEEDSVKTDEVSEANTIEKPDEKESKAPEISSPESINNASTLGVPKVGENEISDASSPTIESAITNDGLGKDEEPASIPRVEKAVGDNRDGGRERDLVGVQEWKNGTVVHGFPG